MVNSLKYGSLLMALIISAVAAYLSRNVISPNNLRLSGVAIYFLAIFLYPNQHYLLFRSKVKKFRIFEKKDTRDAVQALPLMGELLSNVSVCLMLVSFFL